MYGEHCEQLHPYHVQSVQELQPEDYGRCVEFSNWLLQIITEDSIFLTRILWTDEGHFTRDGINSIHNYHLWNLQNPHTVRQLRFQHRFGVNTKAVRSFTTQAKCRTHLTK